MLTSIYILIAEYRHAFIARSRSLYGLLGRGETDGISTQVVDRVVLSQEGITDNPKGSDGSGNIHTDKRRDTSSTSVQDVVFSLERVVFTAKLERELGELGNGVAVDSVLTVPRLSSSDPEC